MLGVLRFLPQISGDTPKGVASRACWNSRSRCLGKYKEPRTILSYPGLVQKAPSEEIPAFRCPIGLSAFAEGPYHFKTVLEKQSPC
jgi:hypothetical protein